MRSFIDLDPNAVVSLGALKALRHCLGVKYSIHRNSWGYRNVYSSSEPNAQCEELVAAGLMTVDAYKRYGHLYYRATYAGMQLAGVTKKRLDEEKQRLQKLVEREQTALTVAQEANNADSL